MHDFFANLSMALLIKVLLIKIKLVSFVSSRDLDLKRYENFLKHDNNSFLGHNKLIFCSVVAHASFFNPPRQTFLLENQRMERFFLSFYKVLNWSKYFYIFLFHCSFTNSLSLFIYHSLSKYLFHVDIELFWVHENR